MAGAKLGALQPAGVEADAAHTSADFIESRRQVAELDHHVTQLDEQLRTADDAGNKAEVQRPQREVELLRTERERIDHQAQANLQAFLKEQNRETLGGEQKPLGARRADHPVEQVHAALKAEGIEVSHEEVSEALREAAGPDASDKQVKRALKRARQQGAEEALREDIAMRKAVDLMVDSATPIPAEQAAAREKLWTPEKDREAEGSGHIWTPGS
jgi:FKBP-type peptidyl-prolyl cis-trans isomerase (trigger factor)